MYWTALNPSATAAIYGKNRFFLGFECDELLFFPISLFLMETSSAEGHTPFTDHAFSTVDKDGCPRTFKNTSGPFPLLSSFMALIEPASLFSFKYALYRYAV